MKRVFAICLIMVMLLTLSGNVFAADSGFVSSPTGKPAPGVESFDPADDDCTANIIVTPYGEKHELPQELQTMFQKAYEDIVNNDDLTTLNTALAKLVKDMKLDSKDLAVSDLFDIHLTGCDYHEGHEEFDVVLSADMLKHFVALLHMNKEGQWELVSDAQVTNNGTHLKFSVDSFSPFAIVVDNAAEESDKNGDDSMIHVFAIAMAVSAAALVVLAVKSKKQSV